MLGSRALPDENGAQPLSRSCLFGQGGCQFGGRDGTARDQHLTERTHCA
jgi:hypothetical protein